MKSNPAFCLASAVTMCLLTGCSGLSTLSSPSTPEAAPAVTKLSGAVHGGQQPISGATIQLYAVGTTGDGSAPTPLLSPAVQSDASGNFTLNNLYTCPTSSTLVYITATGGNPGLSANNTAITLMAALGQCGALSSSTFINLNEVTTVATAVALAPFITAPFNIGSSSSDTAGLTAAFNSAAMFVNVSTGTSPGAGYSANPGFSTPGIPVSEIDTLANILAACVNSPGGTASDTSTFCGKLFSLTGSSADTASAIVALEKVPAAYDTASLFALPTPTAPFSPALAAVPADFGVVLTPPSGGSSAVRVTGGNAYEGSTIAITSTTPDCLYGSPSVIQINVTSYASGGYQGCGRITGVIPTGLPFGVFSGAVFTSTPGQTYNVNYPFYVNVVPKPDTSIAPSPTTLYWIGTAGVVDYTQDVLVKNNTNSTLSIEAPYIAGSSPANFSITDNECATPLFSGATCRITVQFSPTITDYVTASLVISANTRTYLTTVALAGTGMN